MERTVILYHGNCPDGFGGAYAAWKKFGDAAEYVPLDHQKPLPVDLAGADAYFIDICPPQAVMDEVLAKANRVTVLDHHEGMEEVIRRMPEFVYDASRSGAAIAWSYFHPDEPLPLFLQYVQEGDLYSFTLPDARALLKYAYTVPFEFAAWDDLARRFEDPGERAAMLEKGEAYAEYAGILVRETMDKAKLVRFEGHECYFAVAMKVFTSDVGNQLARRKPPMALIAHARPDGIRISLRGDGSVNVAEIAQKYGGNGHPSAAAFTLSWGDPLPWSQIPDEDPRD